MKAYILEQVSLGGIDAKLKDALLAKVNAALSALDRGNTNDAKVATNELNALISQVNAQTNKKITPEVAAIIIESANAIIAILAG